MEAKAQHRFLEEAVEVKDLVEEGAVLVKEDRQVGPYLRGDERLFVLPFVTVMRPRRPPSRSRM
jgi:hypothetical protein